VPLLDGALRFFECSAFLLEIADVLVCQAVVSGYSVGHERHVADFVAFKRDRVTPLFGFGRISGQKLRKALDEFDTYVVVNEALIPNYGERWRNEEAIATGFVESAVNQIVSKRFSKKQQMQWTKKGAHLVLQMRTQVLDERLEDTFRDWYPDFRNKTPDDEIKQAA
jgi:hypothetical protein